MDRKVDVLAVMARAVEELRADDHDHLESALDEARAAVDELIDATAAYLADLDAGGEGDQHETRLRIALEAVQP